jgi:hypothetical protein
MGIATLAHFSRAMIRFEQARAGLTVEAATRRVANRIKTTVNTIDGILRQRTKRVCETLRTRIVAAALSDIEKQIEQLDHERRLLEAMGFGPSHDDCRTAEDALETARSCLARMRGGR